MRQIVKIITSNNHSDLEEKINNCIKDLNNTSWYIRDIQYQVAIYETVRVYSALLFLER